MEHGLEHGPEGAWAARLSWVVPFRCLTFSEMNLAQKGLGRRFHLILCLENIKVWSDCIKTTANNNNSDCRWVQFSFISELELLKSSCCADLWQGHRREYPLVSEKTLLDF